MRGVLMGVGRTIHKTWPLRNHARMGASPRLAERCAYFRRYDPPLPWLDWIDMQLLPDRDDYEVGVQELERMGVGNFAEWKAWVDSEDDAEPA